MNKCVTRDFILDVPDDWVDRSMITWTIPANAGFKVAPNILCARDVMGESEEIGQFVNRQLKDLMKQVKKFDLISRRNIDLEGKEAVELLFSMEPQGVRLKQKQVYFVVDASRREIANIVATAAHDDFAKIEDTFETIFSSVTWTLQEN